MPADPPTPAELVEAESALRKSYKEFKKAMDIARRQKKLANRLNKRCFRNKTPMIPAKIYKSVTVKTDNGNHPLIKLPPEVKNMIFKVLPLNADRASLALSCKDQAATYEQLKSEKNKKDYENPVPKRATEGHRLQMLVRLKIDMAPKYKLCYLCLQFIQLTDPDNQGRWGGSEARVSGLKATKTAMVEGPRCPLCVAAKQLETAKHKETYKKYLALAEKWSFKK